MSEDNGNRIWVSDLDGYIDIDGIDEENERHAKQELLNNELDEIGEFQLLAGKAISARQLYIKKISPSEWRQALHQSEMTVGFTSSNLMQSTGEYTDTPVTRFLQGMLNLGRPYAIARYARREQLDFFSAMTATLPYGIRALINQLLASEGIARTREVEARIRNVLDVSKMGHVTAYRQTGMLQIALHQIANESAKHLGGTKLNRDQMRAILALARLYFSTIEIRLKSIEELRSLYKIYELERVVAWQDNDVRITTNGRFIRAWRLRHVQPLIDFYPYSIRHGLERALAHKLFDFDRENLVNELALAHCGILRMRAAAKNAQLASSK
jgi:hypothetical protein